MTITAYIPKGVTRITETVDIGSVTLVGGRDLVEPVTFVALENDIDDLQCADPLDQSLATSTALVASGAAPVHGGTGGGADKDGSGAFFWLRNHLHAICRFLGHGLYSVPRI